MGQIRNQQPRCACLRTSLEVCRCGSELRMFGCENPRCENYHLNKRFFYHEIIKTQAEIDAQYDKDHE